MVLWFLLLMEEETDEGLHCSRLSGFGLGSLRPDQSGRGAPPVNLMGLPSSPMYTPPNFDGTTVNGGWLHWVSPAEGMVLAGVPKLVAPVVVDPSGVGG